MKVLTRGLAVAAVLSGAAVGLAGPASAEPLSGSYAATATEVNPPGQGLDVGDTMSLILTPCGSDCTTMAAPKSSNPWQTDLHQQGNTWTGTGGPGGRNCAITLDNNSLALVMDCPEIPANMRFALAKTG